MKHLWILLLTVFLLVPAETIEAQTVVLQGSLSAANQDGSDPNLFTDANGIVPSTATGQILGILDTTAFTFDFNLSIDGITQSLSRIHISEPTRQEAIS